MESNAIASQMFLSVYYPPFWIHKIYLNSFSSQQYYTFRNPLNKSVDHDLKKNLYVFKNKTSIAEGRKAKVCE